VCKSLDASLRRGSREKVIKSDDEVGGEDEQMERQ
jgi:hypothetical protein